MSWPAAFVVTEDEDLFEYVQQNASNKCVTFAVIEIVLKLLNYFDVLVVTVVIRGIYLSVSLYDIVVKISLKVVNYFLVVYYKY